jgi:transcriptional antiterminator RfaH
VLVQLAEKEVNKVFEIPGVVRYLFEYGKRAEVSNEEVLAMKAHVANTFSVQENKLVVGDIIQVPLLDQEALLLSVKGKNCIAQLKKLGAVVTFQLK